jgi:hypothetical protein
MKTDVSILLLAAFCIAAHSPGQSAWAYVPSSLEARSLGAVAEPYTPSEAIVRVVGTAPTLIGPAVELRRVLAVDITVPQESQNDTRPPLEPAASAIPQGARWPDSSGRIVAVLPESGTTQRNDGIRNPWEVRVHAKSAGNDTVFLCGGIVAGGEGGPIAILNGHVVKRGDLLGKFHVASIFPASVILGRSGLLFVLPLGRSTTVSMVDG